MTFPLKPPLPATLDYWRGPSVNRTNSAVSFDPRQACGIRDRQLTQLLSRMSLAGRPFRGQYFGAFLITVSHGGIPSRHKTFVSILNRGHPWRLIWASIELRTPAWLNPLVGKKQSTGWPNRGVEGAASLQRKGAVGRISSMILEISRADWMGS